ncbi:hypothetical protein evm_005504 [Chilo suppressalis]|nr:hypothetical protein evm_005504 [Chilo suppressalis]
MDSIWMQISTVSANSSIVGRSSEPRNVKKILTKAMRWKILWFITTLVAITYIDGLTVNESNNLKPNIERPLTLNQSTVSDSCKKNAEISSQNNVTKEVEPVVKLIDVEHDLTHGRRQRATANEEAFGQINASGSNSEETMDPPPILVETDLGVVQGHIWQHSDKIISYFDIPYGKFSLFEAPEKASNWTDIHSVTEHKKRCPQIKDSTVIGSPDCLTLSVFTPRTAENAGVLFYIHDSSSNTGSGDPYKYGPEFLVNNGIILVLPNYRLGALGFLCLQNTIAPGNAAIRDLALALEWTKDNIKSFGGNPLNIVVSGDSRSGVLAGHLALSSESKAYIRKVITESGSVLAHWAIDRNPVSTATQLVTYMKGAAENNLDDAFNKVDIEHLIKTTHNFPFKPCIEENSDGIIRKSPWNTLKEDSLNITFMIGSADNAALPEALQYDSITLSDLNENFENSLPNDLNFPNAGIKGAVGQRIREQYFGNYNITSDLRKNLSLYYTDVSYLSADVRLARALVEAGVKVFLYEFSFIGKFNDALQSIDSASRYGATRGDAAGYIFSLNGRTPEENSEEEKVIEIMTNLWISFIKNGEPTLDGVTWHQFNSSKETLEPWLSISDKASSETGFHYDRLGLWTEVYRDYFIDHSGTINTKAFGYIYYATALIFINVSKNIF